MHQAANTGNFPPCPHPMIATFSQTREGLANHQQGNNPRLKKKNAQIQSSAITELKKEEKNP